MGTVIEDNFGSDGEDEVAFAMEINLGEVLDLLFIFGFRKPPLDGIGGDAVDGVVEDLSAVDGLVKVRGEGGDGDERRGRSSYRSYGRERVRDGRGTGWSDAGRARWRDRCSSQRGRRRLHGHEREAAAAGGDLLNGAEEVFGCGVGEAVSHEVGMHRFVHGVAPYYAFESGEESSGFTVGDYAVRLGVAELEGPAGDGIEVRLAGVLEGLQFIVAGAGVGAIEDRGIAAQGGGETLALGIGVDALVKPGVFELLRGDHAIPILVAELMLSSNFSPVSV